MCRLNYPIMTAEIKNKPKGKSRAEDTRIDVRFPLSILQAIEQIAEQDGAKIHHISGKRILTPTVIELVRLGLGQVSDKYQLEISDKLSDSLSDKSVTNFFRSASSPSINSTLGVRVSDILPDK